MEYKVLIVESDDKQMNFLSNFLKENFVVDVLKCNISIDGLKVAKDKLPNLIILNLNIPKFNGFQFLDRIEADIVTKDIPIIIISNGDFDSVRNQLILYDIKAVLTMPIDENKLLKVVKDTLSSENKFSGSYTNRFIKSFISFNSSQSIASKMMAIVDALSYKIQIPTQKKMDIKSTLAILSTTIKNDNLLKTIKLYKDMHFAIDILSLLKNFLNPRDIYEEIIFIIYKIKFAKYNNIPIHSIDFKDIDKNIVILIKQIIHENIITIKSGLDFELVWERLTDVLMNDPKVDFEVSDCFITYIKEISIKLMLEIKFYEVKIINEENNIKFLIDVKENLTDKLSINTPSCQFTTMELIDDNHSILITLDKNISESKNRVENKSENIKVVEKTKKQEPLKNNIEKIEDTLLKGENFEVMSAVEYLNSLNIDIHDDLDTMEELERDWDTTLIFLENSNSQSEELKDLGATILDYSSRIDNTFYEFEAIGYALKSLGESILNINSDILNENDNKKLLIFLWQLKEDISKWRNLIFVEQNVENVHYLDSSLLSSCMQIKSIITKEEIEAQDEEDIFF